MKKYRLFLILVLILASGYLRHLHAQDFRSEKLSFRVDTLLNRLKNPWSMVWLPSSSGSSVASSGIVAERNGKLILFNLQTKKRRELTVPAKVYQSGQGGILDLALDPDYSRNGWIYLTFSLQKGLKNTTALARFKIAGQKIDSFQVVFEAQPPTFGGYHYGSRLVFSTPAAGGPDLFMTVGERNLREPSQDINNHIGKVIRFDYRNNFKPQVYSYGHRNSQGMVWDFLGGQLMLNEHGAKGGDEINIVEKGKNYGWPVISYGKNYDGSKIGEGKVKPGMEQPMYYWDPSIAPSGFAVYQGDEFPEWTGNLLLGSLKFGLLVRLELNSKRNQVLSEERMLNNRLGRIRFVGVKDGIVYLLSDSSNGKLYRLTRIK